MIGNIITNSNLPLSKRLRRLSSFGIESYKVNSSWKKRFKAICEQNSGYLLPGKESTEKKHNAIWCGFRRRVNLNTFRVCKNISGVENEHIIPEDIFTVDIEPTLNPHRALKFYKINNLFNSWFSDRIFSNFFCIL